MASGEGGATVTEPTLLETPMVVKGSSRYGASPPVLRASRGRGDVANATSSFIGFRVFRGGREAKP